MQLQLKIIIISFLIAVAAGSLLSLAGKNVDSRADFFTFVGVVSFFAGLLQLITGLLLLFRKDKRWAQGFLLSGILIMVIGFATCLAALPTLI